MPPANPYLTYDDDDDLDYGQAPEDVEMNVQAAAVAIQACANDIQLLWSDPNVQTLLTRQSMRPEELPGL